MALISAWDRRNASTSGPNGSKPGFGIIQPWSPEYIKASNDYAAALQKHRDTVSTLTQIAQGQSKLSYDDQLKSIKEAHDDQVLNNDVFAQLTGLAYKNQVAKNQKQAQDDFAKKVGPVGVALKNAGDFVAGGAGMVHDLAKGTPGSATEGIMNGLKGVQHQVNTTSAQQSQTIADQYVRAAQKSYGEDLAKGKITKAQYDQVIQKAMDFQSKANAAANAHLKLSNADDPAKVAAGLAEIPLYATGLGEGGAIIAGGVKAGVKQLAGNVIKEGIVNGAAGATDTVATEGKNVKPEDILHNAELAAGLGAAIPLGGAILRGGAVVDKAVGAKVADTVASKTGNPDALAALRSKGILGAADSAVSGAIKDTVANVGEIIGKTRAGAAIQGALDKFQTHMIASMHPVYKLAQESDRTGKTVNGYRDISTAVNDEAHAPHVADGIIAEDSGQKKMHDAIIAQGKDFIKNGDETAQYIAARQEKELMDHGKKSYTPEQQAQVNDAWEKAQALPHQAEKDQAYHGLSESYRNQLETNHANGLIEDDDYKKFKEDPHEYIRVQREQPDWKVDKAQKQGRRGGGGGHSLSKSDAVQARNKYAFGKQLDPRQVYHDFVHHSTKEHLTNTTAKTIRRVLEAGGMADVRLLTGTEQRLAYRQLLKDAHDEKINGNTIARSIRTNKNAYRELAKQVTALQARGRTRVAQELNKAIKEMRAAGDKDPNHPLSTREVAEALASLDHKDFRALRKMVEGRSSKMSGILDTIEKLNRDLQDSYAKKHGLISDARGLHVNPDLSNKEHFSYLDKGIRNIIHVDPTIGAAIKGYNKEMSNALVSWLAVPTFIFKVGTTTLNVAFAAVNLPKDILESLVNSERSISTHMNPLNHLAVFSALANRPMGPEEAAKLAQFVKWNKGGRMIDIYARQRSAANAVIDAAASEASFGAKAYTYIKHPTQGTRQVFSMMNELIGKTEDYTRFLNWRGHYEAAIHEGHDVSSAIVIANKASRENSINFLEHGDIGQVINAWVPYFNATIQSNRMLARTFRDRPVSTIAKLSTYISMPVAVSTYWNTSDPKRLAVYKTIPEYVKQANFVIVSNDAKWDSAAKKWTGVVLLPKPIGYGSLADPIRQYIEFQQGANGPEHASIAQFLQGNAGNLAGSINNAFSPIDVSSSWGFLSSITPQWLKPTAESITGKDFYTGKDIVPPNLADLPPEEQKYQNYSRLTTYLGAILNTSPLSIDHWIKGTFGEVGTNAQNLVDRYALGAKDNQTDPTTGKKFSDVGGRDLPESVARRFSGAPGLQDQSDFYKTYNPILAKQKRVDQQITTLVGQGKRNQATRIANDFNNSIAPAFEQFQKKYGNSPTYNKAWDDNVKSLQIKTDDRAFNQRLKSYQKKQSQKSGN